MASSKKASGKKGGVKSAAKSKVAAKKSGVRKNAAKKKTVKAKVKSVAAGKKNSGAAKKVKKVAVKKNFVGGKLGNKKLSKEVLGWLEKFHAYTNYVGAACLYLKDNYLLERPLEQNDIKDRVLGHWGTVPGLNFLYAHLNYLISKHKQKVLFVTGPGHGAPANLACNFADGCMYDFYGSKYSRDIKGLGNMCKGFSWPYELPSHVTPDVPGSILEGGELGYSLATSFGAAMDNPDLLVACVVGDGEAETGPLAAAWHSNKFINAKESGAVLPIVHVNGYKISGPSIMSTMSDKELTEYFNGLGYHPYIVNDEDKMLHHCMADAMERAYQDIKGIQEKARKEKCVTKVCWPVIVFRSKKGWTGTKQIGKHKIEDNYRSHGIPLKNVKTDREEFKALEDWLLSYDVQSLVDEVGGPSEEVLKYVPQGKLRMGVRHADFEAKNLKMPKVEDYEVKQVRGQWEARNTGTMADWLNDLMVADQKKEKQFRFFCPDETDSNKFGKLLHSVGREYYWPVKDGEECIVTSGRVLEILSETTLQGWLQGYNLSGRHGLFVTYEAFGMINASMVDQHCKFIKQAKRVKWRKPIPSLNYILSSVEWRQEHNGYSHQNPSLISNTLDKHGDIASVYFPADANTLMVVMEECFKSRDKVNMIESAKQFMPQWQTLKEARKQLKEGIAVWDWIDKKGAKDPDIVFCSAGDYMVEEMMAAIDILRNEFPDFKIRHVNVLEMTEHGLGTAKKPVGVKDLGRFNKYFTADKPVIFSFHGYPKMMQKLLWGVPYPERFDFRGYQEEGSTSTPFDIHFRNETTRFHLIVQAMKMAGINMADRKAAKRAWAIMRKFQKKLDTHLDYVKKNGVDLQEVVDWRYGK